MSKKTKLTWKHPGPGYYCNREFRVYLEGRKWWLSDARNGTTKAPSWWFYTAKEAKEAAELVAAKPCGFDFSKK